MSETETRATFSVAADIIARDENHRVLFVRRKYEPFQGKLALPGGFVEDDDATFQHTAARELAEETGIDAEADDFVIVGVYSQKDRDPRGRVVSVTFAIDVLGEEVEPAAGDDAASLEWHDPDDLTADDLAFDHKAIIDDYLTQF